MWGAATRGLQTPSNEAHAGFGDDLLAELVAEHSQPLPPEATNAQARARSGALRGRSRSSRELRARRARISSAVEWFRCGSQRAAMLQYVVGTGDDARRVSVLVYDAQKIQVGTANLAPRAVGTAEVRVGREKGYSVAATQRGGVGYLRRERPRIQTRRAQLAAMVYDDR